MGRYTIRVHGVLQEGVSQVRRTAMVPGVQTVTGAGRDGTVLLGGSAAGAFQIFWRLLDYGGSTLGNANDQDVSA